jgi:hypothetical protein
MQPCHVCGGMEIDANGYCQRCRAYRGAPGYDPAQGGQPGAPPYGGPYPDQGYPGGYQAAGYQGPGYQAAGYQGPGYQAAGYQGPGYQPRQRSSFTVPLIALSVVAVILVAGIVGVILIRARDSTDSPGSTAAEVDRCVVGTWKVTSAREKVLLDDGPVDFTGSGATVIFRADGTGEEDFGAGTTFRATMSGQPVVIKFTGKITFNFRTVDRSMTFSNVKADGEAVVSVSGVTTTTVPLDEDTKPAKYTCSGNSLVQETDLATTEMRKS